ncbi:MAG TPA: inositol monophosphatase family protein [Terrimesophilobacter sp.]|nr:inositol monophosphatase family protein [Terrimesophilobacter sp.]
MTDSAAPLGHVLADDLTFALELADLADSMSLPRFRATDLVVSMKPDMTHVTDADKAVENGLRESIAAHRPGDSIYGEEFGTVGDSRRQWIIDPIDGTANFVRGVPVWTTLIALAVDGVPVLGVVSAPALARRWWGAAGLGASTRDIDGTERSIRVSGVAALADASVSLSGLDRFEQAGKLENYLELARIVWRTRDYSDAWPYMLVAEGVVDVAGEFDLQTYDMAALFPIVSEAGGMLTAMDGQSGPWHGSALATNGLLHEAVREILGR